MNNRINVPKRTSPFTPTTQAEKNIYASEQDRLIAEARSKAVEGFFAAGDLAKAKRLLGEDVKVNNANSIDNANATNSVVNVADVKNIVNDPKTKNKLLIGSAILGVLVITYFVLQSTK